MSDVFKMMGEIFEPFLKNDGEIKVEKSDKVNEFVKNDYKIEGELKETLKERNKRIIDSLK